MPPSQSLIKTWAPILAFLAIGWDEELRIAEVERYHVKGVVTCERGGFSRYWGEEWMVIVWRVTGKGRRWEYLLGKRGGEETLLCLTGLG